MAPCMMSTTASTPGGPRQARAFLRDDRGERRRMRSRAGKEGDVHLLLWPLAYTLRYCGMAVHEPVLIHGVHGYFEGAGRRRRSRVRLSAALEDHGASHPRNRPPSAHPLQRRHGFRRDRAPPPGRAQPFAFHPPALEARRLVQPQHDVEVLNRRPGGALAEIVEDRDQDGGPGLGVAIEPSAASCSCR